MLTTRDKRKIFCNTEEEKHDKRVCFAKVAEAQFYPILHKMFFNWEIIVGFFPAHGKKIVVFFPQSSYHSRFYLPTEKKDNCKFSIYKMASPYIDSVYIILKFWNAFIFFFF